jgi:small subunit ribosomal protein S2
MPLPTLRDLVDAGAQFGHQRSRTYPTAKSFIYALRERVYVIDLEKTVSGLETAAKAIELLATQGKQVIFVGTKQQAIGPVQAAAEATGMSFINHRWLGGTLTNFDTLRRNIDKLERLEQVISSEQADEFTKQERGRIKKQIAKLDKSFKGLRNLKKLPDAVVVIDVAHENIAIAEANALKIPVFALVDTDANPALATHVIPGNDDSRKTIELVLNVLVEAILAGKKATPVVQATATPVAEQAPVVETVTPKKTAAKKPTIKKAKKVISANE